MRRVLPMVGLAAVSFAVGAIVAAGSSTSPAQSVAQAFVAAWTRGDYATMYSDIDAAAQRRTTPSAFASSYQRALTAATATRLVVAGGARDGAAGMEAVPVRVYTRLFGTLRLSFAMRVSEASGEGARVAWSRSLDFPGLAAGEVLGRATSMPRRATVLARDGGVLAETQGTGGSRVSPLGEVADAALGSVGPAPAERRSQLEAEGVPASATVGLSGLEESLDARLRGTPGGQLLALDASTGATRRVFALARARAAAPVHSSLSGALQQAAVAALGSQLGGIVVLQPSTGQILAVAGLGLDGLQPPGSTFKMVTVTGVLADGVAKPHTAFPYASYATLDGVKLDNANGESCGGTLEEAFAVSCNSVFAPLGVKLGAARLVAAAERFGFNRGPGLAAVAESTLPAAASIEGELALGSTAIGQGEVLATPLQMALVAATIGEGGMRPQPKFVLGPPGAGAQRAIDARVARTVRKMMLDVVRYGTGTAAAIQGVEVAGKTGTAELKTQCAPPGGEAGAEEPPSKEPASERCHGAASEASNTDAWFAAFAPAVHPRVAVCVMLVKDGAGGTTAAPVAREVIEAALRAGL